MAQEYWIDIIHARRPRHTVGDYIIVPQRRLDGIALGDRTFNAVGDRTFSVIGKKYRLAAEAEVSGHHHHRSRSPRYWNAPLFYTVDYGEVPVTASQDEYEIPDDVAGPLGTGRTDTLKPGDWLNLGQQIISKNGRVKLVFQKDGNFVLYGDGKPLWNTGTGPGRNANRVFMQTDGNLVVYAGAGTARATAMWASNTHGNPGARLIAQDDGNGVVYIGSRALWNTETHGFKKYESHSFGSDIVHTFNTVTEFAGKPLTLITDQIEKIPVLGDVVHAVIGLDPGKALGGIAASVLQGERIDHAFLEAGKKQLAAVKEVAPYVQTVMSFVPGVGTGVAAAIAAGTALAEGRSITDAVMDGLKGSVPGGSVGKAAFSAVTEIVKGNNVLSSTVDAVKKQLPPAVQRAVDTAIAASHGKNVREAILQGIRANLPPDAKKAVDIAVAVGTARNAQVAVAQALAKPGTISKLAARGVPPALKQAVPSGTAGEGFKAVVNALQHRGITPTALASMRSGMTPQQRTGFDAGVKAVKNHFTQNHTSLVRGGIVARGNWRKVRPGEKGGIPGRLVSGKSFIHGTFVRV